MPTLAVIWRAADLLFATGVDVVVEVLPPLASTPAPTTPPWVRGLFSHRGRLIPLVDVSGLLGAAAVADRKSNRVLVVRCALNPESLPSTTGLWVQSVVDLERVDFSAAGSHPGFDTESGRFLGPVVETRWGQVQLVNPEQLFSPQQASILAERLKEAAA